MSYASAFSNDGFSNTSDGCSQCETIDNMPNTTFSMGAMQNAYAYPQQSTNPVVSNLAQSVMPGSVAMQVQQPPAINNNVGVVSRQSAMNNMVVKAVNPQAVATAVQAPNVQAVAQAKREGFQAVATGATTSGSQLNIPGSLIVTNLVFVLVAALATNEAVKYYLNKALQSSEASVPYYLIYAVVALLWLVAMHYITKRVINGSF